MPYVDVKMPYTTMKIIVSFVFAVLLAHLAESRLSKSDLRKTLSGSPVFSHPRDGIPEPQNVNLVDFVEVGPTTVQDTQTFPQDTSAPVRPTQSSRTSNIQRGQSQNNQGRPTVSGNRNTASNDRPFRPQPPRQQGRPQQTRPLINDRMADRVTSQRGSRRGQGQIRRARRCPFVIPTFVIPDSSMTQNEFDRQYLIPALRAHAQDERCNSPDMMLYLDLLLYIRERIFKI